MLTRRERFKKTVKFDLEGLDRIPNMEFGYWDETVERWHAEGLPASVKTWAEIEDYFELDPGWEQTGYALNYWKNPPFTEEILEETDTTRTVRGTDGVVRQEKKQRNSIPHFIKFPVEDEASWRQIKERYNPYDKDRYPADWNTIVAKMNTSTELVNTGTMGFFGLPRFLMGLENLSVAYYEKPELIHDICDYWAYFTMVFFAKALYEVNNDLFLFWEDMAYRNGPLISPAMFQEFMTPRYKKVIDFIKGFGVDIFMVDTDGKIDKLIPLFLEVGINALFPFECVEGLDLPAIRAQYPTLGIVGGIDKKALARGKKAIDAELEAKLPILIPKGGYIPMVDHRTPPDVSFDNYKYYCKKKKELIESIAFNTTNETR